MNELRRWSLGAASPLAPDLAADARLSQTDFFDDQVWRLQPGVGDSPALALQTRYGGRAGLVSLVPMWTVDGRTIYQAQGYAQPWVITAFAPGYLQAEAALAPTLGVRAEFWTMESHAIGGRFTLANTGRDSVTLRLDLFAHVVSGGKELPARLVALADGATALSLGRVGNLRPVILIDNGTANENAPSARLGAGLTVPAGGKASARWVHAARPDRAVSVALAQRWLKQGWTEALRRITQAAQAVPIIETGDEATDAAIAWSYHQVMQAYLKPTGSLPHASFVATRHPDRGYSPRGDSSDYPRAWLGQVPTTAYLTALATAPVDPALAQGIVRNYLAVQRDDGWIDWMPGLGGETNSLRRNMLCLPILARLAWGVFQYTEDAAFLRDVFPGLVKFLDRWLQADLDVDGDGLPEWQAEAQTGYPYFPTFAATQPWGQHSDIRTVEGPGLAAYLLSEAASLREMAYYLRDAAAEAGLAEQIARLHGTLESLWRAAEGRYAYRDRDSHTTTGSVTVLDDGYGDEQHVPSLELTPPNRLLVRVSGGLEHLPRMTLHLEGTNPDGQPVQEMAPADAFLWTTTRGVYTSRAVFGRIDRVWAEGLTRPYRIRVTTLDTTRLDINALLPLWSPGLPPERAEALVILATSEPFWRASGVTMAAATDPQFDSANERGSGGVWPFWLTLIGEGLIETGRADLAADLIRRLIRTQVAVLTSQKAFGEWYHSDAAKGYGEAGHVAGVVPLHLLLRVLGVRVVSAARVWTGGPFAWGEPVTIRQRGVVVRRSADGTEIRFPSGGVVTLQSGAVWQEVNDPGNEPPEPAV